MRPVYHYAPAANWLSDPNGLVHHAGEWHLFYQYNPHGEDWGHMSWGHAVSRDLARWEELPVALHDDARQMIFSGSAVIDRDNSAGFGADAMIALYTAALSGDPARQVQSLAFSADQGRSWNDYAGNPVIDRDLADFRDPNVFWHAPSRRWIMVVALSEENRALLYASADLRNWDEVGAIAGEGAPGEVWECPLLIELPVEGGGSRWLFKVDVLRGAPGSGAIYRIGTFDGVSFVPDADGWKIADWGADFYAAIAWHEPRDLMQRPLWIGWMGNHSYQGQLPRKGWRGAMSLPRRIWLREHGKSMVLCQEVAAEAVAAVPRGSARSGLVELARHLRLSGDAWQLRLRDAAGRQIDLARYAGKLQLRRTDPACPALDAEREAEIAPSVPVDMWLDAGSIELLGTDGTTALTMQHTMFSGPIDLRLDMTGPA